MKNLSFKNCLMCGEEFQATKPNQKFCSDNCRQAKFRENGKEKDQALVNEFNNLQTKPQRIVDEIRVVSPEWSKLKTKLFYAQREYDDLVKEWKRNQSRTKTLQNGYIYGFIAAFCSTALIGISFTLNHYNSPIKRPLKAVLNTFSIIAALSGFIVFIIASLIGKMHNAKDSQVQNEIIELLEVNKTLSIYMTTCEQKIKDIEELLLETPEFESEIIKTTNTQFLLGE